MRRQSSGGELVERDAVEDARIADDGVQSSEGIDGCVDDGLPALGAVDRVVGGDGTSAGLLDLLDHLVGDAGVGALPVHGAAEIIDDNRCAAPGQLEGIEPAEPATCACNDCDLAHVVDHVALLIHNFQVYPITPKTWIGRPKCTRSSFN